MAVVLRVITPGLTAAKYDEIVKKLDAAGAGSPAGRLYHVCFGDTNDLRVSDIWESREAFEKFGETLKPIMIAYIPWLRPRLRTEIPARPINSPSSPTVATWLNIVR